MRLEQDRLATIKNYIHAAQSFFIFLAWVLTIAVFTKSGYSDGRVFWYFALCWLTIPMVIYLVMVPMWSRARRFANVYAFASVDGLAVVLWLTAWASAASYVASGKDKGDNPKESGCNNFLYGEAARCQIVTVTTIFGVIIMLLFIATTFISFRAVFHFRRTGMLPVPESVGAMSGKGNDINDPNQEAFSSNMHNDDFDEEHGNHTDPRQGGYTYQQQQFDEEYAPIHQNDHDEMAHMNPAQPSGPLSASHDRPLHDYDTEYYGAHSQDGYNSEPHTPGFQPGYRPPSYHQ